MTKSRPLVILAVLIVLAVIAGGLAGGWQPADAPGALPEMAANPLFDISMEDNGKPVPLATGGRFDVTPLNKGLVVTCVGESGDPVNGAMLCWLPRDGMWVPAEGVSKVGRTDAKGRIELHEVPEEPSAHRLGIYHAEYLPVIISGSVVALWRDAVEVQLRRGEVQRFRVQDRVGRAIQGVTIIASPTRLADVRGDVLPAGVDGEVVMGRTGQGGVTSLPVVPGAMWMTCLPPSSSPFLAVLSVSERFPCRMPAEEIVVTMARPYIAGVTVVGDQIAQVNAAFPGVSFANAGQNQLAGLREVLLDRVKKDGFEDVELWAGFPKSGKVPQVEYELLMERSGWLVGTLVMEEYAESWSPMTVDASARPSAVWGYIDVDTIKFAPGPLLCLQEIARRGEKGPWLTAAIEETKRFKVPPGDYYVRTRYSEDAAGLDLPRVSVSADQVVPLKIRLRQGFGILRVALEVPPGTSNRGCGMQMWSAGEMRQARLLPTEPVNIVVPAGAYRCLVGGDGFETGAYEVVVENGGSTVLEGRLKAVSEEGK